jgi:hypothetical protein
MGLWSWLGSLGATLIAILIAWPVLPAKGLGRILVVGFVSIVLVCGNLLLKFHTEKDAFEHIASLFGPLTCNFIVSDQCSKAARAPTPVVQTTGTQTVPPPMSAPPAKSPIVEAPAPVTPPAVQAAPPPLPQPLPAVQAGNEYANLDGTILGLMIPDSAKYSFYDWLDLIKRTPGINWQEQLKIIDGPCNFLKKGTTRLALDGRPDISDRGTRLATWDVNACGMRSMVASVTFHRSIADQNRTDEIEKGFLQSVRNTGGNVQKIGCNLEMGRTEQVDYYGVKLGGKRKAILATKMFCSSGGCDFDATIHLSDSEPQALKFDGRQKLSKTGC